MRTILLNVSEQTYKRLQTDAKRIHGTIGQTDEGYDFHEHARNNGAASTKDLCVHPMKHGRVSFTASRMKMYLNINCDKERFALESFVDQNMEAAAWMKSAWLNYHFDMPYGVWNQ